MSEFKVGDIVRAKGNFFEFLVKENATDTTLFKITKKEKHSFINDLEYLWFSVESVEEKIMNRYRTNIKYIAEFGYTSDNFELVQRQKLKLSDMIKE